MYNVFAFKIKKRVFAKIIIKGYECHCDDGNRAPDAVNVSVLKSSLNLFFYSEIAARSFILPAC